MQAERAAEVLRHRAAQVVALVEHQEAVLDVADLLVRAVDLDGVREAREQRHHARALARHVLRVVQRDEDAPRAARQQERLQPLDALGVVQPQRREARVEDAQLAAGRGQQPVHRLLEFGLAVERPVLGLRGCLAHRACSRCR
ncbi:MAG: hypothetical protein WD775_01900 [Burkholderiales bacterium]